MKGKINYWLDQKKIAENNPNIATKLLNINDKRVL